MAERISAEKVRTAVGKAVQDALTESTLRHGPIICGFVAPEGLSAQEARTIADETARAVGGGARAAVEHVATEAVGHAARGAEAARALPSRVIICGIWIDPNTLT